LLARRSNNLVVEYKKQHVLANILPVQYLFNLFVQASKQANKLIGKQSIKQAIAQANDQASNRLSK